PVHRRIAEAGTVTAAKESLMSSNEENHLIAERREKLRALREQGNPFPNDFRRDALADDLHGMYGHMDEVHLEQENIRVHIAGRMMLKRVMGKASFVHLQDESGRM